ncbi:hypothetical protein CIP100161_02041 [Corynebacterium diphtheriae]|nr:hypothetical protein CIP100161_02041 [Corynebacterium diphtheriae]
MRRQRHPRGPAWDMASAEVLAKIMPMEAVMVKIPAKNATVPRLNVAAIASQATAKAMMVTPVAARRGAPKR